jgi:hypothetical protein
MGSLSRFARTSLPRVSQKRCNKIKRNSTWSVLTNKFIFLYNVGAIAPAVEMYL